MQISSAQEFSRIKWWYLEKKKAGESALRRDTSLALRKLLKCRFASEMHNIPSHPFLHSGLKETIFKHIPKDFLVASLARVCGAVGGSSRCVGGVCGCSDAEGGAQKNLKARFGFPGLRGKRKKAKNGNSANHIQLLTNPVWREVWYENRRN